MLAFEGRLLVTIGRSLGCDVVIEDDRVSRQHATIQVAGEDHLLADSGSSNGTRLNGRRLAPGTLALLRDRDTITVGGCSLTYVRSSERVAAGTTPEAAASA